MRRAGLGAAGLGLRAPLRLFLAGSVELFAEIKNQVEASGTQDLIERDFLHGLEDRKQAMHALLRVDSSQIDANTESLFFFSQERVEFQ